MKIPLRNRNLATDKGIMNGRTTTFLTLLFACVAFGCSSYSVRDGIWELSFQAQVHESRVEFPLPNREVRVTDEADESVPKNEIVEIALVGTDSDTLVPMYGEIPPPAEESEAKIFINHRDATWIWRMFGIVRSEELIEGTEFMARAHQFESYVLEGRWRLKWLREE